MNTTGDATLALRSFESGDQDAIIALIDSIYAEYGDRICLEDCDGDLLDIPSNYAGGRFMVLVDGETIVGTIAVKRNPENPGACFLKRLYLRADLRGGPWADRMLGWALDAARDLGMSRVEGWSDTRFTRAHAFYVKHGFTRGETRTMNDGWEPYQEFYFSRAL